MGHFLCAKFFHVEVGQIILYPLGGISQFSMDFSIAPYKELLILFMGPLFQCFAYYLLLFIFNDRELVQSFHYGILFFNLLPIYPLDGGKILNVLFNFSFSFRTSFKLSIFVSYVCVVFFLFSQNVFQINIILTYVVLLFLIRKEELKSGVYFHKFLLERLFKNYFYSHEKWVRSEKKFYRYYKNRVIKMGKIYDEKDYLKKFFKNC